MPTWLAKLLELVPTLVTPVAYAAATYGFFHWLDKKASGQAKKAISDRLKSTTYDKVAVGKAVIEMFDRVYTRPLLGWRAFVRSSLITIGFVCFMLYERNWNDLELYWHFIRHHGTVIQVFTKFFLVVLIASIICDYVSLFVVRRWLIFGSNRPVLALVTSPVVGICAIASIFYARDVITSVAFRSEISSPIQWAHEHYDVVTNEGLAIYITVLIAALFVHVWLAILAFFMVATAVLVRLMWLIGKAQWFLKQGQHHPYEAVGYVASAIVFVVGAVLTWVIPLFKAHAG